MKRRRKIKSRCGDFGGRGERGKPCKRAAAWGVKGKTDGPCMDHTAEADKEVADKKQAVLDGIADGSKPLIRICQDIDLNPATIWRWRQSDTDFDELYEQAIKACDYTRTRTVEDVLYRRLVAGDISASAYNKYLAARDPERWARPKQIEHTGKDGQPLIDHGTLAILRQMADEEDAAEAAKRKGKKQ